MRVFKKILVYTSIALGVLLAALLLSVFLFKDKIIRQFINEANKNLNTPVNIAHIDVSVFEKFPQLSIVLKDVYVEDSHPGQYPLLTAAIISFQLNPFDVWRGDYVVHGLRVSNSETNLKIDTNGRNNYTVLKESKTPKTNASGTLSFALNKVSLENTRVRYHDIPAREDLVFTSRQLTATIQSNADVYDIAAGGEVTTEKLEIDGKGYLTGKSFTVDSELLYDDAARSLSIRPSQLTLNGSSFDISGSYVWKDKNVIDLKTAGKDTDIQTIVSLLPEAAVENLARYQSKGDVYFSSTLQGEISKNRGPSFTVTFGCKNATIFHPEYRSRIEETSVDGSFACSELTDLRTAVLVLKNVRGQLNGEPFAANFVLQNFNNPEVICDFKGRLDAGSVLGFYPIENIRNASGHLIADVSFQGQLALLEKRATAQRVSTQGSINLQDISFLYGVENIQFARLRGDLQFSNNDLALSNVSGKVGNSDFLLNGFFKNVITFLLFDDQPLGIEADLKSGFLDLDQLFALGFGKPQGGDREYRFDISRNINLNFNCDVSFMRYKRFRARQLKGDLLVKNEMAVSRNITLKSMGGDMMLSGIVDAKNKKAIDVVSTFKVSGIDIDSMFYVFENFNQNFIEDKHLRGKASADVTLEMALKPNLRLFPETLIADIGLVIRNGELNDFEPMKKLDRYLHDEGLNHLRFSDLKNDVHIENKTIFMPQMEVRTNVTSLRISGTHTFDQRIDYRIITPLRKNKPVAFDAREAVKDDGSGQSKLFLKITGTSDNYRVQYDTDAVKKKIATDLKNEVKELKDAFKNKGTQKKKELELEKDEYFDWEESPDQ